MRAIPLTLSAFGQYWLKVSRAAFFEVRDHFVQIAVTFALLPIGDYFLFHRYGRKVASEMGEATTLAQLYPLTILGIVVLLFYVFLIIPFRLDREKQKSIASLTVENNSLKTPSFRVEHNSQDIGPTQVTIAENGRSEFTQYRARIINESAVPLEQIEVYCDDCIVTSERDTFLVIFGGSRLPRQIAPGGFLPVGIIRLIVEKTADGAEVGRRIEVQAGARPWKLNAQGNEFLITVTVEAANSMPVSKRYQFGDRNGMFYFEEISTSQDAIKP